MIRIARESTGNLGFPNYEDPARLSELIDGIAKALGTTARPSTSSPLELLVGFEGYPDAVQLWWDGGACELGCSEPCGVDMDAIADLLLACGAFASD
jgi:hypothetical protein